MFNLHKCLCFVSTFLVKMNVLDTHGDWTASSKLMSLVNRCKSALLNTMSYLGAIIWLTIDNFWRCIQRTAAVCLQEVARTVEVGQTEIRNLSNIKKFYYIFLNSIWGVKAHHDDRLGQVVTFQLNLWMRKTQVPLLEVILAQTVMRVEPSTFRKPAVLQPLKHFEFNPGWPALSLLFKFWANTRSMHHHDLNLK